MLRDHSGCMTTLAPYTAAETIKHNQSNQASILKANISQFVC